MNEAAGGNPREPERGRWGWFYVYPVGSEVLASKGDSGEKEEAHQNVIWETKKRPCSQILKSHTKTEVSHKMLLQEAPLSSLKAL